MRILKKTLISLICTIAFLGIIIIGGYIFVRSKYGIDLFRTVGQLKVLSEKVDENILCPNGFGEDDFAGLKLTLDTNLANGFITYSEGNGYNGYSIDYYATAGSVVSVSELKISERQTGALGQLMFYEQTNGGKISVSGKDLTTTIKQIDFSNISDNGNANLNLVVQIDLTSFTSELTGFPYGLFKKYIPDSLYVSSTIFVEKTDSEMDYKIFHKELKINNLSDEETADLFHTLDTVLKIGTAENLNLAIGGIVTQVLIGDSENSGFAYSLKGIFNTYNFKTMESLDYFVIEK